MRRHLIALLVLLNCSVAYASSYQQIDGTIVDPIPDQFGGFFLDPDLNLAPFADLSGISLTFGQLNEADLRGANLTGANLADSNFPDSDLTGAILADACLGDAEFVRAMLDGADLSNTFLLFAFFTLAEMRGVDLSGASLESTDLRGANLWDANLTDAFLDGVRFDDANLRGARLTNAVFNGGSGSAIYDAATDFTGTGFDPVAAGWRLVPEPSTGLLLSLGLIGLSARRRTR